ncbi:MFS family permease [Leifsonia sp. EB41]|uniref:MFS transporter n=1 Tax=Leifsonia sp. EB41 TaxID=3156260 RepID=UPI003511298B
MSATPDSTVSDPAMGGATGAETPTLRALKLRGLLVTLASVALVVPMLWGAVQGLYLALQVQTIDPAGKLGDLALIVGIGALGSIVAAPIAGALSDRTRTRVGGRIPWMLVGAAVTLVVAVLFGFATTIGEVLAYWILIQISTNFIMTPLSAHIPDRVPLLRRGTFSAVFGLGTLIGSVLGQAVGAAFASVIPVGYMTVAGILVVVTVVFALVNKRSNLDEPKQPISVKAVLQTFWVNPIAHPNFAWTFAARFAFFLGYFVVQAYALYWLQSYVGLGAGAVAAIPLVSVVGLVGMLISTPLGGLLLDRLGRTKPMIYVTSAVLAVGLLIPIFAHTFPAILVYSFVAGLGFGAYQSVDYVLVTQVLPSNAEAGKDLGIVNISTSLPQTIGVAVAGGVVAFGGYAALFPVGAALVAIGALLIIPIRGVR